MSSGQAPKVLGGYQLLAKLGRGGMGQIWLARRGGVAGIEKVCVLKTLRDSLAGDREHVARFLDEARVVVQLSHRNLCPVFDVGFEGGTYYFAMELVDGVQLRQLQRNLALQSRAFPEELALYVTAELLAALDYAHRFADPTTGAPLHLVHRDLSPQNVVLNFEGEVKLIDFGLALSAVKEEETAPQTVMGKAGYLAPEQVLLAEVDGRADLYAMGVMLYEMLTAQRYYGAVTGAPLLALVARGDHQPDWGPVPERLRPLLERALAFRREDRFASAKEMLAEVEKLRAARAGAGELRTLLDELMTEEREQMRQIRTQAKAHPSLDAMPAMSADDETPGTSGPLRTHSRWAPIAGGVVGAALVVSLGVGALVFLGGAGAGIERSRGEEALAVAGLQEEDLPLLPHVEASWRRFDEKRDEASMKELTAALEGFEPTPALARAHLQRVDASLQELAKADPSAGALFEAEYLTLYKSLTEAGGEDVNEVFEKVRSFEQRLRAKRKELGL